MLLNLVSNAIKFTPYGGYIDIIAKLIHKPADISVDDELLKQTVS